MNSRKIITLLFIGIAAGILIAPDKGAETRKKLSGSIDDLSDYLRDLIDALRNKVNTIADEGIEHVDKMESKINDVLSV